MEFMWEKMGKSGVSSTYVKQLNEEKMNNKHDDHTTYVKIFFPLSLHSKGKEILVVFYLNCVKE